MGIKQQKVLWPPACAWGPHTNLGSNNLWTVTLECGHTILTPANKHKGTPEFVQCSKGCK